jgi:multimeric flavodoxin WrbA
MRSTKKNHLVLRKNSMKILACIGSYRKSGNTAQVVGLVESQLHLLAARNHEMLELETLYLGHEEIRMCRGCRICFDEGEDECPLKDGLQAIKTKMEAADGLLVASPVYVNDVSGATKNWVDRLAYICHRPQFAGKCAYLLASVGNGPTGHALRTLNMALSSWGYYIVGQAGFKTGALMDRSEAKALYQAKAGRVAQDLFHAIYERRFTNPSFLSLMTFKIQQRYWQRAAGGSIDYEYWRDRGWTEPRREYYIAHNASRAKVASARLSGSVLARFVT